MIPKIVDFVRARLEIPRRWRQRRAALEALSQTDSRVEMSDDAIQRMAAIADRAKTLRTTLREHSSLSKKEQVRIAKELARCVDEAKMLCAEVLKHATHAEKRHAVEIKKASALRSVAVKLSHPGEKKRKRELLSLASDHERIAESFWPHVLAKRALFHRVRAELDIVVRVARAR